MGDWVAQVKSRLRVLLLPEWYPSPENPVTGIFVRDQARAIADRHDVTVLAPPSASAPPEIVEDGVRTVRLPTRRVAGRAAILVKLRDISASIARLRDEGRGPDLVHAHVFSAGFLAVLVGRRWRLPVVISEHLTDIVEGRMTGRGIRVARFAYRHAQIVCPVSPMLERSVLRLERRARCIVVPEVVDVEAFAGPPRVRSTLPSHRLLTAGLARQKGLPHLLEALRLLVRTHPMANLEVIGDGPDRAMIEADARGLPVTFSGAQSRPQVAARMRQADIFVMSSLVETFGIAPMEALAAGLPVVATSAFPVADVVEASGGLIVPPADAPALCQALATLLDHPADVPPGTIDDLRRRFGPQAIAEQFDVIYHSLARRG